MAFSTTQKTQIAYWLGYSPRNGLCNDGSSRSIKSVLDSIDDPDIEEIATTHLSGLESIRVALGSISLAGVKKLGGDNPEISGEQKLADLKQQAKTHIAALASLLGIYPGPMPLEGRRAGVALTWI